jgi:hypothetical protein
MAMRLDQRQGRGMLRVQSWDSRLPDGTTLGSFERQLTATSVANHLGNGDGKYNNASPVACVRAS